MKISVKLVLVLLLLAACSSCRRKQGRPNAELCTYMEEERIWECEDAFGNVREETKVGSLLCTTPASYNLLESYVDGLELKVRELQTPKKSSK